MKTSDFDYHLPKWMISQTPREPRDHSRLMLLSRSSGDVGHFQFYDLLKHLRRGDLLVFNDSRVFPARLYGTRSGTGRPVELLLLRCFSPGVWRALVRPGRWMREGDSFQLSSGGRHVSGEVLSVESDGDRIIRLDNMDDLGDFGVLPMPPYIRQPLEDQDRYQTVYARVSGSVAAPTAGLHFTRDLLERIRLAGVETVFVTLHVGWDSFRPVRTEEVLSHELHSEYWELGEDAAEAVNCAKRDGRRVISVGTTAVRLLEQSASCRRDLGVVVSPGSGWSDLFIYPGYKFRVVDALITNFHLPRSTLLMLVSAFAGRGKVLNAYQLAVEHSYRFYSFGDAMLIS